MEQILHHLERAAAVISLVGVAIIVGGFLLATVRYAVGYRKLGPDDSFQRFREELGQPLILGLEILVVADVITTITVTPTFRSLAVLAALVMIRTVVSWTLTVEVEGRWPWQPRESEPDHA